MNGRIIISSANNCIRIGIITRKSYFGNRTMHGSVDDAGKYSPFKMFSNIFISFVGAGMLGLPFAFQQVGIFGGITIMTLVAMFSIKSMLLVVECKNHILDKRASSGEKPLIAESESPQIDYGDLASIALGPSGFWIVQASIVLSQVGFCCGYLIFISHNLFTLAHGGNVRDFTICLYVGTTLSLLPFFLNSSFQ
eukprot:m.49773 g.49773  ORF g.49773 m.49773 type:complete len:195 (-) comp7467_c3_seq4:985-1569(-)